MIKTCANKTQTSTIHTNYVQDTSFPNNVKPTETILPFNSTVITSKQNCLFYCVNSANTANNNHFFVKFYANSSKPNALYNITEQLIQNNGTLQDLINMNQAYATTFSSDCLSFIAHFSIYHYFENNDTYSLAYTPKSILQPSASNFYQKTSVTILQKQISSSTFKQFMFLQWQNNANGFYQNYLYHFNKTQNKYIKYCQLQNTANPFSISGRIKLYDNRIVSIVLNNNNTFDHNASLYVEKGDSCNMVETFNISLNVYSINDGSVFLQGLNNFFYSDELDKFLAITKNPQYQNGNLSAAKNIVNFFFSIDYETKVKINLTLPNQMANILNQPNSSDCSHLIGNWLYLKQQSQILYYLYLQDNNIYEIKRAQQEQNNNCPFFRVNKNNNLFEFKYYKDKMTSSYTINKFMYKLIQASSSSTSKLCHYRCSSCGADGVCSSCAIGYFLSSNNCIICQNKCSQCTASTDCTKCNIGYFINPSNSTNHCLNCDPSCLTCDKILTNCTSCPILYFLSNDNKCLNCPSNCLNCTSQDICFNCSYGYTLINDNCFACVISCSTCLPTNISSCTSCSSGLRLMNNKCVPCDSNCYQCTQKCLFCFYGYHPNSNGICVPNCLPPCLTCVDNYPQKCLSCYNGSFISGQTCLVQLSCNNLNNCTGCGLGAGYTFNGTNCLNCGLQNCQLCDYLNTSVCVNCKDGYFIQDQLCKKCINGCSSCWSSNICFNCEPGFMLHWEYTYIDLYYSNVSGICTACISPCATCIQSPTYCVSCIQGYTKIVWKCVRKQNILFNITISNSSVYLYNYLKGTIITMLQTLKINGTDYSHILVQYVKSGSTQFGGYIFPPQVNGTSYSDTLTATSSLFQASFTSGTLLSGLLIISSSATINYPVNCNNCDSVDNKTDKTGLIIGLIMLGVVILTVTVIVIYIYCRPSRVQPNRGQNSLCHINENQFQNQENRNELQKPNQTLEA